MTKEIYKNNWMRLVEEEVNLPNNQRRTFAITEMTDGVTVLCLDDENNVFLVEEFRAGLRAMSLELISGGIEESEDILDAARREVEEETGFIVNDLHYCGMINPFTSIVRSKNHVVFAKMLEVGTKNRDEGEVLKIHKVHFSKLLSMVNSGQITHGASCFAILLANLNGLDYSTK